MTRKSDWPTGGRQIPDGWTFRRWVNELERRATQADPTYPEVAKTYRRWAQELREAVK